MEINRPPTWVYDLGLTAALISKDFKLIAHSNDLNGRVSFQFKTSRELGVAIRAYQANSLNVKARTFFENTKMLKGIIYAERPGP
jgi:hypothetical protein